MKNFSQK